MRNLFLIFCLIGILFSCQKESSKSDFIGNWSTSPELNYRTDIQFFKDSVVIHNPYDPVMMTSHSTKWKVRGSKIYNTLIRGNSMMSKKYTIDYKFGDTKDILYLKNEIDSLFELKLVKINNGYETFENKIGLKLNLPKTDIKLTKIYNNDNGFNIYIGYLNDSLIVKSNLRQNLFHIRNDVYLFQRKKDIDSLQFMLFADKSISNRQLDSIKQSIKNIVDFFPLKHIRIYQHESYENTTWKDEIKWYGIYE